MKEGPLQKSTALQLNSNTLSSIAAQITHVIISIFAYLRSVLFNERYTPRDLDKVSITHPILRCYTYGLVSTIMIWTAYQFFYIYSAYDVQFSTIFAPSWLRYMGDEIDFSLVKQIIVSIATGAGAGLYIGLLNGRIPTRPWYWSTVTLAILAAFFGAITSLVAESFIPIIETAFVAFTFYLLGAFIRNLYDF